MTHALGLPVVAVSTATWGIISAVLSVAVIVWIFMNANKKDPGINSHRRHRDGGA
jgi:hypothetical protein